jgi:hypothetical protein
LGFAPERRISKRILLDPSKVFKRGISEGNGIS